MFFNILITIVNVTSFFYHSRHFILCIQKHYFEKGSWAFHQAAKGVHGTWLPSTHSTQKSTLEGLKMGNSGGVPYTHTHTHTHYPWSSLTQGGLCPGTRAPLAARFSEHLQEWKPLLTRSKTPLRLSQRNTIYYQHVFSFSMFQGDALKRSAYMNI